MADQTSTQLFDQLISSLAEVSEAVQGSTPTDTTLEVETHDGYVIATLWRCVGLFEGARLLIENALAEEAGILGRSLFEDSLRLMALADAGEDRAPLVLGWANSSLAEMEGLAREASRLGEVTDLPQILERVEATRRAIDDYRRRRGVGRPRRFPSAKVLAERFGRSNDLITYEAAHELVHGSEFALLLRRVDRGEVAGYYLRQGDVSVLAEASRFAGRSILFAHLACCSILGWSPPDDWAPQLFRRFDDLFEQAYALPADKRYTGPRGHRGARS